MNLIIKCNNINIMSKFHSNVMNFAILRSNIKNRSNGKQKLGCLIISKHKQLILRDRY